MLFPATLSETEDAEFQNQLDNVSSQDEQSYLKAVNLVSQARARALNSKKRNWFP